MKDSYKHAPFLFSLNGQLLNAHWKKRTRNQWFRILLWQAIKLFVKEGLIDFLWVRKDSWNLH